MAIRISKQEVFNNLLQFKVSLAHLGPRGRYPVLLNRHTGGLRFGHTEIDSALIGGEWEQVDLVEGKEAGHVVLRCDVIRSESDAARIQVDAAAASVLLETLKILNLLSEMARGAIAAALERLEEVEVEVQRERIESLPGWHGRMSRLEAERELEGRGSGVYLIRVDGSLIDAVANSFARANKIAVKFYLLTFNSRKGQISELMLIETQWGWTICRDDSNLASLSYSYSKSPSELLKTLGSQIQFPV